MVISMLQTLFLLYVCGHIHFQVCIINGSLFSIRGHPKASLEAVFFPYVSGDIQYHDVRSLLLYICGDLHILDPSIHLFTTRLRRYCPFSFRTFSKHLSDLRSHQAVLRSSLFPYVCGYSLSCCCIYGTPSFFALLIRKYADSYISQRRQAGPGPARTGPGPAQT